MSWPIPLFPKIEYPKPIFSRLWLPTLALVAAGVAGAVLLLWPHGKPTQTFQFWSTLIGAPLIACALTFGWKLDQWEDEQTDAEESENEQNRLREMWCEWTRRHLPVVDSVAFPGATDEVGELANAKADLPTLSNRAVTFGWVEGRATAFRRRRLLHLIARHFAGALRTNREVVITLMLNDASPGLSDIWIQQAMRVFARVVPRTTFHVETPSAKGCAEWITRQVDLVDPATRIVIAVQLWTDEEQEHVFSEGAAAFLIDPGASSVGSIFRPQVSARQTGSRARPDQGLSGTA
ncbi:hypothetical protein [Burkholderia sp. Ax-1719]|uniref:hypothetical protein n=1 Tax=Burkholderia sp. Ax-1719 TaxID=2608334 RepID=UPI0014227334|nr:hypothetical protein [Burkholderia sp. Ax-1719]NIE62737.1 hypothetical protein [Burkholderia sp. Ax-1719]